MHFPTLFKRAVMVEIYANTIILGDLTSKLISFIFISTELPLIFSAGSGPFWQEGEALKKNCFHFQPSDLG